MSREPAPALIFFDEPTDHEPAPEISKKPGTTATPILLQARHISFLLTTRPHCLTLDSLCQERRGPLWKTGGRGERSASRQSYRSVMQKAHVSF